MKGVKLTERIRYMHCEGEEGAHGILVLLGIAQWPTKAVEVDNQSDFRKFYNKFLASEKAQSDILNPHIREAVLL